MIFQTGEQVFICGQSGAGKTFFAINTFLPPLKRIILMDPKWEHFYKKAVYVHSPDELQRALSYNKTKLIYQPHTSDIEEFDQVCKLVFVRGNVTLFLDETTYAIKSAMQLPVWFGNIVRMGRSRNISVIALTQRPSQIPLSIISEAQHIVAFRLSLEGDRKKIAGIVGEDAMQLNKLPEYHFMAYNPKEGVRWCYPIKI